MDQNHGGWDQGQVFTSKLFQPEQLENSPQDIEQKFLDFLRSFRLENSFVYR
jgi:DNA replication licensing factor MCM5